MADGNANNPTLTSASGGGATTVNPGPTVAYEQAYYAALNLMSATDKAKYTSDFTLIADTEKMLGRLPEAMKEKFLSRPGSNMRASMELVDALKAADAKSPEAIRAVMTDKYPAMALKPPPPPPPLPKMPAPPDPVMPQESNPIRVVQDALNQNRVRAEGKPGAFDRVIEVKDVAKMGNITGAFRKLGIPVEVSGQSIRIKSNIVKAVDRVLNDYNVDEKGKPVARTRGDDRDITMEEVRTAVRGDLPPGTAVVPPLVEFEPHAAADLPGHSLEGAKTARVQFQTGEVSIIVKNNGDAEIRVIDSRGNAVVFPELNSDPYGVATINGDEAGLTNALKTIAAKLGTPDGGLPEVSLGQPAAAMDNGTAPAAGGAPDGPGGRAAIADLTPYNIPNASRNGPFTYLDPANVFSPDLDALDRLNRATGVDDVTALQAWRPERVVLQETIASVVMNAQTSVDEQGLKPIVANVMAAIPPEQMADFTSRMNAEYADTRQAMQAASANDGQGLSDDRKLAYGMAKKEIETNLQKPDAAKFSPEEVKGLIAERAAVLYYDTVVRQEAKALVTTALESRFASGEQQRITQHSSAERRFITVAGGPGSGKSKGLADVRQQLAQDAGFAPDKIDFIYGSTDQIRGPLLGPAQINSPEINKADLGSAEASVIRGRVSTMMQQQPDGPHIIFERPSPDATMLSLSEGRKNPVKVTVIAADIDRAMIRAADRMANPEEGRAVASRQVLIEHQRVSTQVEARFSDQVGRNVVIEVFDNNGGKGQQRLIMQGDMASGRITISDPVAAGRFFDKKNINVNAGDADALYAEKLKPNLDFVQRIVESRAALGPAAVPLEISVQIPDGKGGVATTLDLKGGKLVAADPKALGEAMKTNPAMFEMLTRESSAAMLDSASFAETVRVEQERNPGAARRAQAPAPIPDVPVEKPKPVFNRGALLKLEAIPSANRQGEAGKDNLLNRINTLMNDFTNVVGKAKNPEALTPFEAKDLLKPSAMDADGKPTPEAMDAMIRIKERIQAFLSPKFNEAAQPVPVEEMKAILTDAEKLLGTTPRAEYGRETVGLSVGAMEQMQPGMARGQASAPAPDVPARAAQEPPRTNRAFTPNTPEGLPQKETPSGGTGAAALVGEGLAGAPRDMAGVAQQRPAPAIAIDDVAGSVAADRAAEGGKPPLKVDYTPPGKTAPGQGMAEGEGGRTGNEGAARPGGANRKALQAALARQNARNGVGANASAAALDIIHISEALRKGDKEGVLASTGSLIPNSAGMADDALHVLGKTEGNVSKVMGKLGPVATFVNTGLRASNVAIEGGGNLGYAERTSGEGVGVQERIGRIVVEDTAGFLGGLGGGAAIGGLTEGLGLLGGTITTGGTLLVALAVTAAVSYGLKKSDEALYAEEDKRVDRMFGADPSTNQKMIGMAQRYSNQLANPETGKIDYSNMETLNKLSNLVREEIDWQKGMVDYNGAPVPTAVRGDSDAVSAQRSALSSLKIAESAKIEIDETIKSMQRQAMMAGALRDRTDPQLAAIRTRIATGQLELPPPESKREAATNAPISVLGRSKPEPAFTMNKAELPDFSHIAEDMERGKKARERAADVTYLADVKFGGDKKLAEQYISIVSQQAKAEQRIADLKKDPAVFAEANAILERAVKGYGDDTARKRDVEQLQSLLTKAAPDAQLMEFMRGKDPVDTQRLAGTLIGNSEQLGVVKRQQEQLAEAFDSTKDPRLTAIRESVLNRTGIDTPAQPLAPQDMAYLRETVFKDAKQADRFVKVLQEVRSERIEKAIAGKIAVIREDPEKLQELKQVLDRAAKGYPNGVEKRQDMERVALLLGGLADDVQIAERWVGAVADKAPPMQAAAKAAPPAAEPTLSPEMQRQQALDQYMAQAKERVLSDSRGASKGMSTEDRVKAFADRGATLTTPQLQVETEDLRSFNTYLKKERFFPRETVREAYLDAAKALIDANKQLDPLIDVKREMDSFTKRLAYMSGSEIYQDSLKLMLLAEERKMDVAAKDAKKSASPTLATDMGPPAADKKDTPTKTMDTNKDDADKAPAPPAPIKVTIRSSTAGGASGRDGSGVPGGRGNAVIDQVVAASDMPTTNALEQEAGKAKPQNYAMANATGDTKIPLRSGSAPPQGQTAGIV